MPTVRFFSAAVSEDGQSLVIQLDNGTAAHCRLNHLMSAAVVAAALNDLGQSLIAASRAPQSRFLRPEQSHVDFDAMVRDTPPHFPAAFIKPND